MTRKRLTAEEEAAFNSVLLRAVERMERRQRSGFATEEEAERLAEAVGTMKTGEKVERS